MARLRLLFALLLMAVGTSFGALAISGYYEPHMIHGQPAVVSANMLEPQAKPQLPVLQPRQRFVAIDDQPAAPPAKPTIPKSAKAPAKAKATVKDKRPPQAAMQWPWSLFSN
jgi:hypothetical protein